MSVIERTEVVAPSVTERDVLHRAADLIEEFGWECGVKGDPWAIAFRQQRIPMCILGATYQARIDLGDTPPAFEDDDADLYEWAAEPLGGNDKHCWYIFNDRPERTSTEVVTALREAAERAA